MMLCTVFIINIFFISYTPDDETYRGKDGEDGSDGKHDTSTVRIGKDEVADGEGAKYAADSADCGDTPDSTSNAVEIGGECTDEYGRSDCEEHDRNKVEGSGCDEGTSPMSELEEDESDGLEDKCAGNECEGGGKGADVKDDRGAAFGAVGYIATDGVAGGEGNHGDDNLGCPDELRVADASGKYFGAEYFNDHDGGVNDRGAGDEDIAPSGA